MRKIICVLLLSICFISCANKEKSVESTPEPTEIAIEYEVVLNDVFEVLEETDKEKLETMFGEAYTLEWYENYYGIENFAYIDKQDYKFNHAFHDGTTSNGFILKGYEDNEEITIQIKEQLEKHYGFQMEEINGMFSGIYLRLYYYQNDLDFYFSCYYRSEEEKSHMFGKYNFSNTDVMEREMETIYMLKEKPEN